LGKTAGSFGFARDRLFGFVLRGSAQRDNSWEKLVGVLAAEASPGSFLPFPFDRLRVRVVRMTRLKSGWIPTS